MAYLIGPKKSVKKVTSSGNANDSSTCNCKAECTCHEKRCFPTGKVIMFLFFLLLLGVLVYLYNLNSKSNLNKTL